MKKLKCECGREKFYRSTNDMMDNVILASNPPYHVSVYVCVNCGKRHEIRTREDYLPKHKPEEVIIGSNSYVVEKGGETS